MAARSEKAVAAVAAGVLDSRKTRYGQMQDVVGGQSEGLRDYVRDIQSSCHGRVDP